MSAFRILPIVSIALVALTTALYGQSAGPPPVRSFADSARSTSSGDKSTAAAASTIPRFATKSRKFAIPFSLVSPEQVIVEVHLFASTNRGQSWAPYRRADLRQNEFEFVAASDGEYWFAVQTLNRNGERIPARVTQPELIVVVDTVPPTLEARSKSDNAGRVLVEWRARDDNLAADSLVVRYRPNGASEQTPWIDVPTKVTKPFSGPLLEDSFAFWPESNEPFLDLEVNIRDQAGNQATAQTSVQRAQVAPQFASMRNANTRSTNDAPPATAAASSAPLPGSAVFRTASEKTLNSAVRPGEDSTSQASTGSSNATAAPVRSNQTPPQSVEWKSVRHSSSGKFLARGSTQEQPETPRSIQPSPLASSNELQATELPAPQKIAQTNSTKPQTFPAAQLVSDRVEKHTDSEAHSVLEQRPISPEIQSQTVAVRSKRFRLNYQVEAIDPAGVKEVAVWTTRDEGRSWSRLGSIPDPQGPFPVEVDESGLYGFRLVVISHSGLKSRLPQPGDPADKWVRVDVDPPIARITGAPYGTGEDAGKLVINWEAYDDQLALRPIDLAFSTQPAGPWTTIESGLRNTGSYAWEVQADSPDRVYLRLTVRDEAGNTQIDQTSYPIDISDLYPRGRINGVEPVIE